MPRDYDLDVVDDLTVLRETELAILVTDGDLEVWLPKSQLGSYPAVGQTGEVELPDWLAIEKGLA